MSLKKIARQYGLMDYDELFPGIYKGQIVGAKINKDNTLSLDIETTSPTITNTYKAKSMNKKKMFYVGSSTVVESTYLKTTMQEAIESAKTMVAEQGGTRYVVKVVAIVREKKYPVEVEIIK